MRAVRSIRGQVVTSLETTVLVQHEVWVVRLEARVVCCYGPGNDSDGNAEEKNGERNADPDGDEDGILERLRISHEAGYFDGGLALGRLRLGEVSILSFPVLGCLE
ncbi:hypothetical protein FOVG_18077 [Fusarium oxysporum f. sp. pisi HDV247]|uniref:Uncharacterized protein n=1 Tax=Fusarium oxysporum f. sp. pisi HDV247 TaxID=1080344 RepID=W9NCQ4_FUSOX|nr:hypothetical protein FOVG_18077 [Fusarium oxysporum f. sp. pisi HDV247]